MDKAVGYDEIGSNAGLNCYDEIRNSFCYIFSTTLATGIVPDPLKYQKQFSKR